MSAQATSQVRTTPLSVPEVHEFLRRGLVFPGRILSSDQVEDLRERIDSMLSSRVVPSEVNRVEMSQTVPSLNGLWKSDAGFRAVSFDARLTGWVSQLLDADRMAFMLDNVIVKEPLVGGEIYWHQDWYGWPVTPTRVVSAWIALEDVTRENGAMQMAVGSHALGRMLPFNGRTGEPFPSSPALDELSANGMKPIPQPEALGLEIVDVELAAGEVVLFDGLMWHRSGINSSPAPRHSLIQRYADSRCTYSELLKLSDDVFHPVAESAWVGRPIGELGLFPLIDAPVQQVG